MLNNGEMCNRTTNYLEELCNNKVIDYRDGRSPQ